MLKRTVSSILFTTLNNRRLFSLTSISNRQEQRSTEVNNQHREFGKFHSRSSNSRNQFQRKMVREQEEEEDKRERDDLDARKPRFNRYNISRTRSRFPQNKKSFEDDDNDIFSEEKDDLTMLGTDKKAFAPSLTTTTSKPTTKAVSLSTKSQT